MLGMLPAFLGAAGARADARAEQALHEQPVVVALSRQDAGGCGTHVSTVLVQADADPQRRHVVLGEAGVGAGGRSLRAFETRIDRTGEIVEVEVGFDPRRFEHLSRVAHPNVNTNAWAPGSRKVISNVRSAIGPACRMS